MAGGREQIGMIKLLLACLCIVGFASLQCGQGDDRTSVAKPTITVLYPIDERGLGPAWDEPSKFLVFLPPVGRNTGRARTGGRSMSMPTAAPEAPLNCPALVVPASRVFKYATPPFPHTARHRLRLDLLDGAGYRVGRLNWRTS